MSINTPAGVVYTRPWVADMILDLAGVDPDRDLIASGPIVEPACGDGAFLTSIVRRVVESCLKHGHPISSLDGAVLGYDLDVDAVQASRINVTAELRASGLNSNVAHRVAKSWIQHADFLLETPEIEAGWVVGNPPYVRVEKANAETMKRYRDRWPTMTGRADLYIGFLEAGLSMLNPDGRLGYICPDRWMFNSYGKSLRRRVLADFAVETVVSMHDVDAFAVRVNAYPTVVVLRRGELAKSFVAEASKAFDAQAVPALVAASRAESRPSVDESATSSFLSRHIADWPRDNDGWTAPLIEDAGFVEELERTFPTLTEAGATVGVGPATGADDVFIIDEPGFVESARLLPVIAAADTVSGRIEWTGKYLVNPWDDDGNLVDLDTYPKLALYLDGHEGRLRSRRVAKDRPETWWRTIDRVKPDLTSTPKLLLPDMRPVLHPVLDTGGFLPMHNLNYVAAPDWDLEVLGGLLLSDVVAAFLRMYSVRMARGYLRVSTQYLRKVRIPHQAQIGVTDAESLRRAFRDGDRIAATEVSKSLYGIGRGFTQRG